MNLKPLAGRIVVKRIAPETQTASGIILSAPTKQQHDQGTIVAVGAGVTEVGVGDTIIFGIYSGQSIKVEGEDFLVVQSDDILAVVEG
jgi:chaperonin GroES